MISAQKQTSTSAGKWTSPALALASLKSSLNDVSRAERIELLAETFGELSDLERAVANYAFDLFWAREDQVAPNWSWRYWLMLAGRGWGKTKTLCEWVRTKAEAGVGPGLLAGRTASDVRDILIEGPAGILAISPPWFLPEYEPSKRTLTWPNGVVANLRSADEPDSFRGIQGQWAALDELAAWRYAEDAWSNIEFGLRLGDNPQIAIATTPRPIKIVREILGDPDAAITRGKTFDNAENLAASFIRKLRDKYEGTRLGRQELNGEVLEDTPGALWQRADIDKGRVKVAPEALDQVVVAVDPPVSTGEGADECGIIAAGLVGHSVGGHLYVLADASSQGQTPLEWAKRAVKLAQDVKADRIVAEANQGGEMVKGTIAQACQSLGVTMNVKLVHATRGKVVRAEPVSALYEQGRAHHVGAFAELEDQLCAFTPDFDRGAMGYSPDRLDALVWAATELVVTPRAAPWVL